MHKDPNHATTGPLPEMSRHEASWHEHMAGMRAAQEARASGGNPATAEALAHATAGPLDIGGFHIQPCSQGTIWTLQRLAREFAIYADLHHLHSSPDPDAPGERELIELGLATLAFCDARQCWKDLSSGRLPQLILRAEELMWATPLEIQMELQKHFQEQMERVRALSPGADAPAGPEKKTPQETPAGVSPAVPNPPMATTSPPSSGSPPNTASASPPPSGTPA